jgi:hypothetical protein
MSVEHQFISITITHQLMITSISFYAPIAAPARAPASSIHDGAPVIIAALCEEVLLPCVLSAPTPVPVSLTPVFTPEVEVEPDLAEVVVTSASSTFKVAV